MPRIHLPPEKLTEHSISITGDQARHLAIVLRAVAGDSITVLDGSGFKYECRILSVHKKEVTAEIIGRTPYSAESPLRITLAQGIPKGEKMDLIIQKCTELGVHKVIPVVTERSQVRHSEKTERWNKIALSAAQQAGRDRIPVVTDPVSMRDFLDDPDIVKGIMFFEDERSCSLKHALKGFVRDDPLSLLIGPEGGFAESEVRNAVEKGFDTVSLGPRILRTETAPITAISILQFLFGDIG